MKNYTQNSEEMNWPWVESPFFSELLKNQNLTDEEIIAIILKNPKLIQRPIVVWDGGALIARPIEKLLEKLKLKN